MKLSAVESALSKIIIKKLGNNFILIAFKKLKTTYVEGEKKSH